LPNPTASSLSKFAGFSEWSGTVETWQIAACCTPLYQTINLLSGRCVTCEKGTNGGYVLLFLLLSWGYVLVTHKISQQASGMPKGNPC
jgi:hypothetical protein